MTSVKQAKKVTIQKESKKQENIADLSESFNSLHIEHQATIPKIIHLNIELKPFIKKYYISTISKISNNVAQEFVPAECLQNNQVSKPMFDILKFERIVLFRNMETLIDLDALILRPHLC